MTSSSQHAAQHPPQPTVSVPDSVRRRLVNILFASRGFLAPPKSSPLAFCPLSSCSWDVQKHCRFARHGYAGWPRPRCLSGRLAHGQVGATLWSLFRLLALHRGQRSFRSCAGLGIAAFPAGWCIDCGHGSSALADRRALPLPKWKAPTAAPKPLALLSLPAPSVPSPVLFC